MPFMVGRAAVRRTVDFLKKGDIVFKDKVKIVMFCYNSDKQQYPHHTGLSNFVFWHLPQLQFKNPKVQLVTFTNMTPIPSITTFLEDGQKMVTDCDSRSREDIYKHMWTVLGKTREELYKERQAQEASKSNPANFGFSFARQCICEIPGQVPCPGWVPLPRELTGKGRKQMEQEAEDS